MSGDSPTTATIAPVDINELRIWPVRTGAVPKQLVASSAAVEFAGAAVGDVQGLTESRIVPRMLREGYLSIYVVGALVSGWLTCEVGNDGQMADMKGVSLAASRSPSSQKPVAIAFALPESRPCNGCISCSHKLNSRMPKRLSMARCWIQRAMWTHPPQLATRAPQSLRVRTLQTVSKKTFRRLGLSLPS